MISPDFSLPARGVALVILTCAIALAGGALAQEPPVPEADVEPFVASVDVEIINIDVWVTDKTGKPVEDLSREDFRVLRDGEPVEIANFYAASGGRPVDQSESAGAPTTGDSDAVRGEARLIPGLELAPQHRLWLIVFVDNYNIDAVERSRVLPDIYSFLSRVVDRGGKAMLVSYDRSLEVRQPFTDNLSLLADGLAAIKDDVGLATVRRRERMETLRRIDESGSAADALFAARRYAEELANGVGFAVDALIRFVDTLAGLPGRKALVHVSSGVPMLAGEEAFHAVGEKFDLSEAYGEIPRHATTREFERLGRIANAHRVAFHTVDAGGLRGIEFGAAEYGGFVDSRLRRTLDSIVPENLQSPLRFMALETGGRAILNRNEIFPALEEVRQDFGSFYSLGIASVDSQSGRYHSIDVELREQARGIRLRHRTGYRSKSTETRIRESLRSALLYAHQSNPLSVEVEWGRPEPRPGGDAYLMPIRVAVPLRDVVLLPTGEGTHEARLRLFVAAADGDGGISDVDVVPFGVRLADENVEPARQETLLRAHRLLLAKGRQKVGVCVLDVFGGESSVVTDIIQVGPVEETASGILPPDPG